MKTAIVATVFVWSLVLATTAHAQTTYVPACTVQAFQRGHARTVYVCDAFYGMGSIMRVTVPKPWFNQHCTVTAAGTATCDAIYEGAGRPAPIDRAAAPAKHSSTPKEPANGTETKGSSE